MATTYKDLSQAQAAYDTILQQKQRAQRNDYVGQQQSIMGVNNYLKQNGYNGGAAESILLRARGNRGDYSSYDAQLADLMAIIQGLRGSAAGGSGGGSAKKETDLLPQMPQSAKGKTAYNRAPIVTGTTRNTLLNSGLNNRNAFMVSRKY